MVRYSILSNDKRFEEATIDVINMVNEGHSTHIVPEKLKAKYQEREVEKLVKWFLDLKRRSNYNNLRLILKISLWILLLYKIFMIFLFFLDTTLSLDLKMIAMIFGPIINIIAIYLAINESKLSYLLIFVILTISVQGSGLMTKFDNFSIFGLLNLAQLVVFFTAYIVVIILMSKLSSKKIQILDITKKKNFDLKSLV